MKKIKNFYNKIFVVFSLCFAFVCGLLLIDQNTYAYETNQFSYTLTYERTNGTQDFLFKLNTPIVNESMNDYVFLVNFDITNKTNPYTSINGLFVYYSDYNFNGSAFFASSKLLLNYSQNQTILTFSLSPTNSNQIYSTEYIWFRLPTNAYLSYSDIINIDFVNLNDIYLGQYVDTYYNNLQQQLIDLQQDYDDLVLEYNQVESDLENLQQEYYDLQQEYNVLNNRYNDLLLVQPYSDSNIVSKFVSLNGVNLNFEENNYIEFHNNYMYFDLYGSQWSNPLNVNYLKYTYEYSSQVFLGGFVGQVNLLHSLDDYMFFTFYSKGNLIGNSNDFDSESNPINQEQAFNFDKMEITFVLHDINNLPSTYQGTLFNYNSEIYYTSGYNAGFTYAQSMYSERLENYKLTIISLTNQLNELNRQINELNQQVSYYQNLYNQAYTQRYEEGYRLGLEAGSDGDGSLYSMVIRNC